MGCTGAETKDNYIKAEFNIDEENIDKEVQILNCIQNMCRATPDNQADEDYLSDIYIIFQ